MSGSAVTGDGRALLRRLLRFLARHRWSVPLAVLSTAFFGALARELHTGELAPLDRSVTAWVVSLRGEHDGTMIRLTELGTPQGLAILTVGAAVALLVVGRAREALFLAVACGGAGILNVVLKLFFRRARPGADVEYLIQIAPSTFSFPSGHAMGAMAVLASFVVVLQVLRVPTVVQIGAAIAALLVATGVGFSRIYLGVHFPSDVLGGQLAAAAWVSAVTGWFYPRLLPGESRK